MIPLAIPPSSFLDGAMEKHSDTPPARAVFWDRDGTLMEEVDYCGDPSKVQAISGAGDALRSLQAGGWLNILITNQSGIGRGYFSVADFESVNAELIRQLGTSWNAIYFCPEAPPSSSHRRKPAVGMLEEACRDHRIDPERSWLVGDKTSDISCGQNFGCRTILVLTGYGNQQTACGADFVVADAGEAARLILGQRF
ncbi:MAG: HAD family hydrolase [Terrimicrobiaceae bacterium]